MRPAIRINAAVASVLCTVGCASSSSDSSDTRADSDGSSTASAMSSSSTDAGPSDCNCVPDGSDVDGTLELPQCAALLCSAAATCDDEQGESECTDTAVFAVDETGLECALAALRDRTPGVVSWDLIIGGGYATKTGYVLILPDGNVITRAAGRTDYVPSLGPAVLGTPPDASYFESCMSDDSSFARFGCLAFDAAAPTMVCDEG